MTTEQYQNKLIEKRKSITNFILKNYPAKIKEKMLEGLILDNLNKYTFLRDLETMEVQFKSSLKKYKEGALK